jgi:ribulose-5-phosphate 4-epimerase/fuculose-1-phosphate aldolase
MSEIYFGVKFKEVCIGKSLVTHYLLQELIKWCGIFSENGYTPNYPGGSSGNLSFRTSHGKDGFVITASYTKLGRDMNNAHFVEVVDCIPEVCRIHYKGIGHPSSESFMHYCLYQKRPDINAVFHGHSEQIMKIALEKGYPQTEQEYPYGTLELAKSVINVMGNHPIIIIKNHGFVTLGTTLDEAGNNVSEFKR